MGYAWWHGKTIRKEFEKQAIDKLNPQSYDLTEVRQNLLNVRCPMSERINTVMTPGKTLTFTDLDNYYPLRMTQSFAVLKSAR